MEFDKNDFTSTCSFLQNKYSNIYTYTKHISFILTQIKNEIPLNIDLQTLYRLELTRTKTIIQDLPKKPFDHSIQLEHLRHIWIQRNIIDRHSLIIGLYLFLPALRSDYAKAFIQDNIIHIPLIKVNTDKVITHNIPQELLPYIHLFPTLPKLHKTFANTVALSSKIIFNKTITINMFRRIWTEFGLRTMTVSQQRQLAQNMNHSFQMHNTCYTPLMQPVYKNTENT